MIVHSREGASGRSCRWKVGAEVMVTVMNPAPGGSRRSHQQMFEYLLRARHCASPGYPEVKVPSSGGK